MASELEVFRRVGHPNSKYPWDEWEDGKTRKITQGIDFECKTKDMRTQLHTRANKIERRVATTKPDEKTLVFTFQEAGESLDAFLARTS